MNRAFTIGRREWRRLNTTTTVNQPHQGAHGVNQPTRSIHQYQPDYCRHHHAVTSIYSSHSGNLPTVHGHQRHFSTTIPPTSINTINNSAAHASASVASCSSSGGHLIDGLSTANSILNQIADEVQSSKGISGRTPGLAVILTTSSRDSQRYVQRKNEVAKRVGFQSQTIVFDETKVTKEELLDCIERLNQDETVDGILIQLPLPTHLMAEEASILSGVSPVKDVDGFHPINLGNLAALAAREGGADEEPAVTTTEANKHGNAFTQLASHHLPITPLHTIHHIPCTPKACVELLDRYNISLIGKHVVVLGRSTTVGLPLTLLLLNRRATVTNIDHSLTMDQARALCSTADVLIAAVGHPEYIRGDWIKEGAVVIDVGINFIPKHAPLIGLAASLENPLDARDSMRLVGDVNFAECRSRAAFITPVPGGVGPMTVAMLMENTLRSYLHRIQAKQTQLSKPN